MDIRKGMFAIAISAGLAHAGIVTVVLDDFDSDPNDDLGGVGTYSTIILNNPFNQGADFSLDTLLSTGGDTGSLIFNSGIGVEQVGIVAYNAEGAGLSLDAAGLGVQGFEIDFAMIDLTSTPGSSFSPSTTWGVRSVPLRKPSRSVLVPA
jgi:hypothetical protein